jgi:cellulose synthase/poly-beta-1,6-N-acetylglucosamine synthase-like glycosyltransferase
MVRGMNTAAEAGISVVVPTYNAAATLGPCIEALLAQACPAAEIILVDDGSTDAGPEIAARYPVRLVRQDHEGASAARERGFRTARGAFVAYTDSDTAPDRDWLARLRGAFEADDVGAVTGRTVFRTDARVASHVRHVDFARRYRRRRRETTLANGPNCMYRRQVLEAVGGFDPAWHHAEDTQVSYRVREQGYRILYVPKALVYHVPEGDWRAFLRKRYRDARAYMRVVPLHRGSVAADDFVTFKMKAQPPLFALGLAGLAACAAAAAAGAVWPPLLHPAGAAGAAAALLLGAASAMDLPFALAVARESGRAGFFFKTLALQCAAGAACGAGFLVGGWGAVRALTRKSRKSA